MRTLATVMMCASIALATGAAAMDMKKDSMAKDSMKPMMTMQECKDHMAMAKTNTAKKDDAMMKKDAMCADMMKKDGMAMKDGTMTKDGAMMKKDGMPAESKKY